MLKARVVALMALIIVAAQPVRAQLVANGGFETGNLSGWSFPLPDECFGGVDGVDPHAGNFGFYAGPVGMTCTLTQSLATTTGAQYTFSFWVKNLSGSGEGVNSFEAFWNGGSVYSTTSALSFAYTQQMFTVTATAPTTTVAFTIRHDPGFYELDDVSVQPTSTVPEPSTYALMAAGLVGVVIARRQRRA